MRLTGFSRGDTIIEVLFATTIFSVIALSIFLVMNQGSTIAQRALEINLTRQQMDSQVEMVRFSHDAYLNDPNSSSAALWKSIRTNLSNAVSSYQTLSSSSTCPAPTDISGAFAVKPTSSGLTRVTGSAALKPATTHARMWNGVSEGMWLEIAKVTGSSSTNSVAYDLHVRACWSGVGSDAPVTLGTIVRLYEPV